MSYTLEFLLWLQIDISFIKDIAKTFSQIIKKGTFLLFKSDYFKIEVNA